jgi:ribonucleoside-diphosphate reductase beta chain
MKFVLSADWPVSQRAGYDPRMATLLDLTAQGDVATITDDAYLNRTLKLMNPQQLYELWERQSWQSQAIDLERDKEQWTALDAAQKEEHLWGLSSFFVGEERVTTQFSGLVMAYEDEQEEAFLTTQQVDEARHMQFFDRYYREVLGVDHEFIRDRLAAVRVHVTDAFVELFDERLVKMGERLIAEPSDLDAKVDFVTTYHMVIEGTLALTGQHFMLDYYENEQLLPGFQEGFGNIARDEHRHVAYGTWFLQQKCAQDERYAKRVQQTLNELLPVAAGVLVPKGFSIGDDYEFFGYTSQQQAEFAYSALSRRLKVIGVPLAGAASPESVAS